MRGVEGQGPRPQARINAFWLAYNRTDVDSGRIES